MVVPGSLSLFQTRVHVNGVIRSPWYVREESLGCLSRVPRALAFANLHAVREILADRGIKKKCPRREMPPCFLENPTFPPDGTRNGDCSVFSLVLTPFQDLRLPLALLLVNFVRTGAFRAFFSRGCIGITYISCAEDWDLYCCCWL